MKAEIIAIGTEILMGYIVNTNASWIGQELLDMGIGTYYQQVVGDNKERMEQALSLATSRSDIIIISGGLGPTRDDMTKEVVADFLGESLVTYSDQLERVEEYFRKRKRPLSELDYKQAQAISNSLSLFNEVGLASGTAYKRLKEDGNPQYYIIVPGPPFEMRHMMKNYVKPYLKQEIYQDTVIESQYINLYGIGEAWTAQVLDELVINQSNPTIAIYAKPNRVTIRLTANAESTTEAKALNQSVADQILEFVGEYFIGYGEFYTFDNYIIELLKEHNKTLSVAESLTGGLVMESLTNVAGASQVLKGGFVTYQTETKHEMLGIDPELITEKTVVSPEIARAMAEKTREKCDTDFALALTGVAGPDSVEGKEPGEVYVALAIEGEETVIKHLKIEYRPRDVVRETAKHQALNLIRDYYKQK